MLTENIAIGYRESGKPAMADRHTIELVGGWLEVNADVRRIHADVRIRTLKEKDLAHYLIARPQQIDEIIEALELVRALLPEMGDVKDD